MTAFTTTRDFMKLWTQADQTEERLLKKFLLEGLDTIVQADSDFLSRIKVGKSISTPVVRWVEEIAYPTAVTALWDGDVTSGVFTISGNLFGAAVTADSIYQVIRVGTILERQSDGQQVKVTALTGIADGAPFAATVDGYGNTALAADGAGVTWEIISEVWSDFKDADSSRSLTRSFRSVGTEIFSETFEIPKTRKNTKYEIVADEVEHQIAALLDKLRRQLAYSVLRSRPYWSGAAYQYGNETEESTMCGLTTWAGILNGEIANANTYVNAASVEITKTLIDDLVKAMWLEEHANFNRGNWIILCHPNVHRFIQDFDAQYRRKAADDKRAGFQVDVIDTAIGKSFPVIADRYIRPDVLHVVDLGACSYGYYNEDKMDRKELATQGRYQRWLISMQAYGLVIRKPRCSLGTIYSLATS